MTSISSLSSIARQQPAAAYAAVPPASGATTAGRSTPSSIVQLSPEGLAAAQAQASAATPAARLADIGAALLSGFRTGAVLPAASGQLPDQADNRLTLSIVTDSGKSVALALASRGDRLSVRVDADEGLSIDEREALAGLAQGFQDLIGGMDRDDPQIRLDGLAQFDSRFLRSVDLHAELTPPGPGADMQKLDLHLDAGQRKVAIDGPAGRIDVAVDMGKLETLGTRKQQARAIDGYLKQFDEAAARGHADPRLIGMFKDAFASMSATSASDELDETGITMRRPWAYSAQDHARLTGLADFSATVTQAPAWSNPARRDEADGFQYEVSQASRTGGRSRAERSLEQVQKSHLRARFHLGIEAGGQAKAGTRLPAQNYDYDEIDDAASSAVRLAYKDGQLRQASLEQSLSQSERIRKYVLGKLQSDRTLPQHTQVTSDLLGSLGH
jgi:hypothetical protein